MGPDLGFGAKVLEVLWYGMGSIRARNLGNFGGLEWHSDLGNLGIFANEYGSSSDLVHTGTEIDGYSSGVV